MRLQEQAHEQALDRRAIAADPVIPRRLRPGELESVQRRLAGERRAIRAPRRELAGDHRQGRVMAQLVMVDKVLVTERDPEHPLPNQRRHLMLDPSGIALVPKAHREALHQSDCPIGCAQEQRPRIRRDRPAIEPGHHRPARHTCKAEQVRATLRRHRGNSSGQT